MTNQKRCDILIIEKLIEKVGFADVFGNVTVATAKRTINDGFFGMRMGIEDCNFFIVSKNGLVDLMVEGYTDMLDPKYEYLNFY